MSDADNQCEIGIDCSPDQRMHGKTPATHLSNVLRGTGLQESDFDEPETFFGAWTWQLKANKEREALFLIKRSVLSKLLGKLVEEGIIRGYRLAPEGPRLAWEAKGSLEEP